MPLIFRVVYRACFRAGDGKDGAREIHHIKVVEIEKSSECKYVLLHDLSSPQNS